MTEQRTDPRYRLDSRIATGGMGEVWRATDTVLDRRVAVKVLKPEYADDPTFRSRFEAEARHAAALHHHNVASVFDFGELEAADGSGAPRPYLVMELVPGKPLSVLLREDEPMPADRAADLVAQAADAVAAAHALGIVHRDVKPGNLLVTPRGQVKITDFGIARAADGAALTQTGQVIGTPAYISPEQAEGKPATPASDIYSLGVVLYECLAGRRPFVGDSAVSTALAHLRDDPPPLPDHVPEHLREVVAAALEKEPGRRFAAMADFASALRGGPLAVPAAAAAASAIPAAASVAEPVSPEVDEEPDGTRVMTAPVPAAGPGEDRERPGWLPWAGAALGVLLVVVLLAWLTGGDTPTAEPTAAETSPSETQEPEIRIRARDYVGLPADEARARLTDLGLVVRPTTVANPGDETPGQVSEVTPTGVVEAGDRVTLSVWGPRPDSGDGDDDDDDDDEPEPEPKNDQGKAKGKKKKG